MSTKEEVYENEISPLMNEIINICQKHKIANLCSFHYGNDVDGDPLLCTSAAIGGDYPQVPCLTSALDRLFNDNSSSEPMMMTIEKEDGGKEIHAIL